MIINAESREEAFIRSLTEETGCTTYSFSPTPFAISNSLFEGLNRAVPALLEVIDRPEYMQHCIRQGYWNLPVQPMQPTDFTGCADFLITKDGAKLIEMNINLPGKTGLMQTLSASTSRYLEIADTQLTNTDYMERLVAVIRKAIPDQARIALVVSPLEPSKKHQPHYRYFSAQLNACGLHTTVVSADNLQLTADGCLSDGVTYTHMINLVIPFVWESNPEVFSEWTRVWQLHPERVFPAPTGGMLGTKDLLCYLSDQRVHDEESVWKQYVLTATMLRDITSATELTTLFPSQEMVLKPLKDYDTKGVFVQPDQALITRIFQERRDQYMAQEFTESIQIPVQLAHGETATTHSVIYRVFFAEKQPIGYQVYYVLNAFNGHYYTAPVMLSESSASVPTI